MDSDQINRLILMAEAVLIILTLAVGGTALVGMICYWTVVAVYHLTEYLIMRRNDGNGRR